MPVVNIISAQIEEIKRETSRKRFFYWLLIAELIALGLGCSVMLTKWLLVQGRLTSIRVEREAVEPRINEIKKINRQIDLLQPKLDTLNIARYNTRQWYEAVVNASRSLPNNVWINSLTSTDGAEGKAAVITITGSAAEQQLVGDMMLQMNKKFPKVELHFTQQRKTATNTLVDFEIGGELMPLQKIDQNSNTGTK